ncbi:MAG: V-type ATPase subunit [Lachnospiraceae bacterium]|nr:V-type ATPase subunit [Lachnospiraceae bacterium]
MSDNSNIYAVTRIHIRENDLLTESFLEQLVQADSYEQCVAMLREKGWGAENVDDMSQILETERDKTWELMREVLHEDIDQLDIFLIANDYHNLKSAIKEVKLEHEYEGIYIDQGTVPAETIRDAVRAKEFDRLPEKMAHIAEEALGVFLRTGDGQLCDTIIDKAGLEALYEAGINSGSDAMKAYAELTVVAADIKIALRALRTGKGQEFLEKALAECETLNLGALTKATLAGEEELADYLSATAYADGAAQFGKSMSAFERWCDNLLIDRMKVQKWNPFGIDPIAAYVLARENEIKSVRIILSGKLNDLPQDAIRERIRQTYA